MYILTACDCAKQIWGRRSEHNNSNHVTVSGFLQWQSIGVGGSLDVF
jgi:hypothetical protein